MNIADFEKIAPYLTHPLVLVGFVLLLAYGIHRQLMRSGLLRQVSQKDSGLIIRLFLRYGFWLALVLLLAGFGLHKEAQAQKSNKEAAAARHLGALAYMNKPPEALVAYKKVRLEPDNAEGWNQLGAVLYRTGELGRAKEEQAVAYGNLELAYYTRRDLDWVEEMYRKALELDEAQGSKEDIASQYSGLGLVYDTRGDLGRAEEMYRKALEVHEALDSKEGMAEDYSSLGFLYEERGELDRAEEMHTKSLHLYLNIGHTNMQNSWPFGPFPPSSFPPSPKQPYLIP